MVYSFIIHSLLPGTCRIIYSRRFAIEINRKTTNQDIPDAVSSDLAEGVRRKQKKLIHDIASRVHSEYQFRRAVAGGMVDDDMRVGNDDALPEFESGVVRLSRDEYFLEEKSAVWLGAGNSGFTLVCDKGENLMLAEHVLRLLIRFLQEHTRILAVQTETLLKSDRITMVVEQFLPSGVLLFMNNRVIRQFEKELESMLKV